MAPASPSRAGVSRDPVAYARSSSEAGAWCDPGSSSLSRKSGAGVDIRYEAECITRGRRATAGPRVWAPKRAICVTLGAHTGSNTERHRLVLPRGCTRLARQGETPGLDEERARRSRELLFDGSECDAEPLPAPADASVSSKQKPAARDPDRLHHGPRRTNVDRPAGGPASASSLAVVREPVWPRGTVANPFIELARPTRASPPGARNCSRREPALSTRAAAGRPNSMRSRRIGC
jgi:hypothetical protein